MAEEKTKEMDMEMDMGIVMREVAPYLDNLSALRASHVCREWRKGVWVGGSEVGSLILSPLGIASSSTRLIWWMGREEITLEEYRRVYAEGDPPTLCYLTHRLGLLLPITLDKRNFAAKRPLIDQSTLKSEPRFAAIVPTPLSASGNGLVSTKTPTTLPLVYFTIQSLLSAQPSFREARNLLRQTITEVDSTKLLLIVSRCNARQWDSDGEVRGSAEEMAAQLEIYQMLRACVMPESAKDIVISNFPFIATWRNDSLLLDLAKGLRPLDPYEARDMFNSLCLSRCGRVAERWFDEWVEPYIRRETESCFSFWNRIQDFTPGILLTGSARLLRKFYSAWVDSFWELTPSVKETDTGTGTGIETDIRIPEELLTRLTELITEATQYALSTEHHFEFRGPNESTAAIEEESIFGYLTGYYVHQVSYLSRDKPYLVSVEMDRWVRLHRQRYADITSPYRKILASTVRGLTNVRCLERVLASPLFRSGPPLHPNPLLRSRSPATIGDVE